MPWDIPDAIAPAADLRPGDELWAEPTRDGVVARSDSLRKVYVEATGHCNLRCAMCPCQAWAENSAHMTAACYDRLVSVATRRTVGSLPALIETAQRLKLDFVSISNAVPHTREMAADALFTYAAQVSNTSPDSWRPRLTVGRFDLNSSELRSRSQLNACPRARVGGGARGGR